MRLLDVIWMIAPTTINPNEWPRRFTILVVPAVMAIGGIWLMTFLAFLRQQPLLPLHARFEEPGHEASHSHGHAHGGAADPSRIAPHPGAGGVG